MMNETEMRDAIGVMVEAMVAAQEVVFAAHREGRIGREAVGWLMSPIQELPLLQAPRRWIK